MSDRLLRVTAVAGGRRSDLTVPGGVAVAELIPDLARSVGLLDPAAVYAGYRLHVHGRRLRPDRGLGEQGVEDGALLAVAAEVDRAPPLAHDDLAEATAEAVRHQPRWTPADTRRTTLAAGVLALAVGLGALAWDVVPPPAAAVALALVVLAANALPAVAVAVGVGRAADVPVDSDRVGALLPRSTRLLVVASAAVGVVVVALAPTVAGSPTGAALAADCCVVLLLRVRRSCGRAQVLLDAAGAVSGLLSTVVAVLLREGESRPAVAAGLAAAGLATWPLTRVPGLSGLSAARRARLLDGLETAALVALAPLLLLATDGSTRLLGT